MKFTMFKDFHLSAMFVDPEKHPEAKTLKDFHEKLTRIVAQIRLEIPNADEDVSFKQAALIVEKLLPIGVQLESVEPIQSGKLEKQRVKLLTQIGKDSLINVTGEASKCFAQKYSKLIQAFIDKKYWPDKNCRTDLFGYSALSIFNQSYLSAYAYDYNKWLVNTFKSAINELNTRIADYENHVLANSELSTNRLAG